MEQVCRHDYRSTSCLQHPCHLSPNHANACSCPVVPPLIQQHDAKVLPIACDSGYAYGVAIHSIITQHHALLG